MSGYIDRKYINLVSPQLERFAWKSDTLANCRCPICGDSQKNKRKARGFFYLKGNDYFYKCHNCGAGHSLYRFLESVCGSLSKEYSLERWKNGENARSNYVKPKEENMFNFKQPKFKPKHDLLKPLVSVKDLPSDHICREFVEMRKIPKKFYDVLYYTENFLGYMKMVDPELNPAQWTNTEPRLVIPFFNKDNDVVAVQGRSLSLKDEYNARTTLRYITVKSDKSIERLWYGMWRANPKKRVYVVEGPLDSMFIPNTVAMVGAAAIDRVPARFANTDMVYVLDNEPRNLQIVKFNENLIEQGKTVCIWPNGIRDKDINDMIYRFSPKQIKKMMDDNAVSGLEAKMRLNRWRKV
tara:strand:+ start:6748 stop:7806 length:1059 start_codon:yes stop_codon:yes gene_type:complete